MKAKLVLFFILLSPFIISSSCNMNVKTGQLPEDIKSIYIAKIENNTVSYGLVPILQEALNREFISDGRLVLVEGKTADSTLNVFITTYSLEPLSYDINGVVKEYKMRIGVKIVLYNNKANKVLFEESGIEESEIYVPQNSPLVVEQNLIPQSEEEVKRSVLELIARDIVRRVIDGWW